MTRAAPASGQVFAVVAGHEYATLPGLLARIGDDLQLNWLLRDWVRRGLLPATGDPPALVRVGRINWYLVDAVIEVELATRDHTKHRRLAA